MIIFNAYKDAKRATLVYESDALDSHLIDAFEIIADPKHWVVGFDVYAKFMQCLQVFSRAVFPRVRKLCRGCCAAVSHTALAAWDRFENREVVLEKAREDQSEGNACECLGFKQRV